jgi:putative effector of murein hydrolase
VTTLTAVIELLVGAACVALAWPAWRRRESTSRILAGCLAVAGGIAIANAISTIVR